jgi:hypothetical protein
MSRAGRELLRATAVLLVAMAVEPLGTAIAAPPNVTITSPLNGSVSNVQTPSFSGLAEAASGEVALRIYNGSTPAGPVVEELGTLLIESGTWTLLTTELLKDGTYTAQASQTNLSSETGKSSPVTFTIDTAAPTVTLNALNSPSDDRTPAFTGTASDTTPVTVEIHAGATANGTIVSAATARGTGAGWMSSDASPALSSGQYTAVAIQASSLGNPTGRSGAVTFTVTPPAPAPPPPSPPVAVAPESINVASPQASLMQPFPVVRIAGIETRSGVKLRLLKVQQTPAGAQITARCRGRGCPIKSARRVAALTNRGVASVEFRECERLRLA